MTLLTGLTENGIEVPVQVTADGRLVAEGLQGPTGSQGPAGPAGPVGPAGPTGSENVIINGDMRINQRGVAIAAAGVGSYGPDRWKRTAGGMTQIIEAGNYAPGAVYTLSGTNVTTQQLTAPASGNWTLPNIPIIATDVKLEPGSVATPFNRRPIGIEEALCFRYYFRINNAPEAQAFLNLGTAGAVYVGAPMNVGLGGATYPVPMRAVPIATYTVDGYVNCSTLSLQLYRTHWRASTAALAAGTVLINLRAGTPFILDAEL